MICASKSHFCLRFMLYHRLFHHDESSLIASPVSSSVATAPWDADGRGNLLQDLLRRLPQQHTGPNEFRDGYLEYEEVTTGWTALMHAASQVCRLGGLNNKLRASRCVPE